MLGMLWRRCVCAAALLLAGCSGSVPVTPTPQGHLAGQAGTPLPSPSMDTSVSQVAQTPERVAATDIPSNPDSELFSECLAGGSPQDLPNDFGIAGTLVYKQTTSQGLVTMGGSPIQEFQLPVPAGGNSNVIGFSPTGDWYAITPIDGEAYSTPFTLGLLTPSLTLLSASGKRIEMPLTGNARAYDTRLGIRWGADQFREVVGWPGSHWLNETTLSLVLYYRDPADAYSSPFYATRLFDTASGTWVDEPIDTLEKRHSDGQVLFSPDMSQVLYEVRSDENTAGFVLLNREDGEAIWKIDDYPYATEAVITWAPNSAATAMYRAGSYPDENRLMLIARDGSSREVPKFGEAQPNSYIGFLEWAPDSQKIAWVSASAETNTLYVYDVTSDRYLLRCPLVGFDNSSPEIVWSPDSLYVAIFAGILAEPKPLRVVGIVTNVVYDLARDATSVQWSETWPVQWIQSK